MSGFLELQYLTIIHPCADYNHMVQDGVGMKPCRDLKSKIWRNELYWMRFSCHGLFRSPQVNPGGVNCSTHPA